MKTIIFCLSTALVLGLSSIAQAQDTSAGSSEARATERIVTPIRVIPVAGVASFANANNVDLDNFGDGFAAGVLLDFGGGQWALETGALSLNNNQVATGDNVSVDFNSWGVPLFGKWNMSGNPNSTVFLKAGAMPFFDDATDADVDFLGVAGIGGAVPIGTAAAVTLDATYNRILNAGGGVDDFSGIAILAGLSFGL